MLKIKIIYTLLIFGFIAINANSQSLESQKHYFDAFNEIKTMLSDNEKVNFQEAVLITENAYFENKIDKANFEGFIRFYTSICRGIIATDGIQYSEKDKDVAANQCAAFVFMTDSLPVQFGNDVVTHPPFSYNHEDFAGQQDWSNMFVSTLIQTKRGNCHSLPYLYKIIMDELGYKSNLALAPNHIYIKVNNKKVGWYNIELTCADFPTDAWYAASGYIHTDAIRNGIYMRALSDKESIAMTLVDLAQGYQAKYGIEDGSFIIKCCDTALEYFPNYISAMLLKSEILTELFKQAKEGTEQQRLLFSRITGLYTDIHKLGYRKMPQQMYANWLNSLNAEDRNQGIKAIINLRTK